MELIRNIFILFLFLPIRLLVAYRYIVTTYTGDRFGAGTDARVFAKLIGSKGHTVEKELESSGRDNFERGQRVNFPPRLDTFVLNTKDIGTIKKIAIRHDNSWLGPGWFLEKLTVTSEDGDYYEFPVHKWFDKNQSDGKTTREVIPRPIQKKDIIEFDDTRQPLGKVDELLELKQNVAQLLRVAQHCSWPQGISNGKLADSQISASTSFNDLHLPYHGRLGNVPAQSLGGWCPYKDDKAQYLQVDLGKIKKIAGVATQGMALVDEWTTSYRISYSNHSDTGYKEYTENGNYVKNFVGNNDQNGTVQHWLKKPFIARYTRILPFKWYGKGCLRIELYGCPAHPKNAEKENAGYIQLPEEGGDTNSDDTGSSAKGATEDHEEPQETNLDVDPYPNPSPLRHDNSQGSVENADERSVPTLIPSGGETSQNLSFTENAAPFSQDSSLDIIPVVHLDFDDVHDGTIPDVSGHHNDAHIRLPVDIMMFSKSCERGVRVNGGDIYFDGEFFIDKPRDEITISAWIKLFSNGGQHSIFDTVGGKGSAHAQGQYHFEVDRGALRWFHRNEQGHHVFNISSPLMIPAHVWTHCAATYSTNTGKAAVFVNGKMGNHGFGTGSLSQDWTGRAGIGRHKGQRVLNGEIDEFYIFNKALSPSKIGQLQRRCSFETDCQTSIGMQSKEIKDTQISASSTYNLHKPHYGRVNLASFGGDPARTAWCAAKDDKNPYLEIDLPELTSFTGVATQGLSIFDNWVTSYLFCYSTDKAMWSCYKEKGYDKVFEANSDKNSIKRHYFHHPVDGKYVRIRPQSWYGNHLCMRVEVYGCQMDLLPDAFDSFGSLPVFMEDTEAQLRTEISPKESCNNPMGISNGEVDDIHLTASSSLDNEHLPFKTRLVRESVEPAEVKGCWCAHDVNLRQYIEADLGEMKTITGVATQGYVSHDNWVSTYRLGYSDTTNALEWYRENDDERLFPGNADRNGIVKHFLKSPIKARYIRLNPRAWHGVHICMRVEFFGCKEEASNYPMDRLALPEKSEVHVIDRPEEEKPPTVKHLAPLQPTNGGGHHKLKHNKVAPNNPKSKVHSRESGDVFEVVKSETPNHRSIEAHAQITYPQPKISIPPLKKHINLLPPPRKPKVNRGPPLIQNQLFLTNQQKPKLISMKLAKDKQNNKQEVLEAKEVKLMKKFDEKESKPNYSDLLGTINKLSNPNDEGMSSNIQESILKLAKEKLIEDLSHEQEKKVPESKHFIKTNPNCEDMMCEKPSKIEQMSDGERTVKRPDTQGKKKFLESFGKEMMSPIPNMGNMGNMGSMGIMGNGMGNMVSNMGSMRGIDGFSNMGSSQRFMFNQPQNNMFSPLNSNPMKSISPGFLAAAAPRPTPMSKIDAKEILTNFPELKNNGVDEAVLNKLSFKVPNLEQRIYAHFAKRNPVRPDPPVSHHVEFPANSFFQRMNKLHQAGISPFHPPPAKPVALARPGSSNPFLNQNNDDNGLKASQFGGLDKDRLRYLQSFHDTTKYSPPLNPEGPDPRFVDYYNKYLQGNMLKDDAPPSGIDAAKASLLSHMRSPQQALASFPELLAPAPPPVPPPAPPPVALAPPPVPAAPQQLPVPQPVPLVPQTPTAPSINIDEQTVLGSDVANPDPPVPPSPENTITDVVSLAPGQTAQSTLGLTMPGPNGSPGPAVEDTISVSIPSASSPLYSQGEHSFKVPLSQRFIQREAHWTPWSLCSVTCGRGEKKRFRRCLEADCPSGGVEIDTEPCGRKACDEGDPYEWSPYSPCSVTCGIGASTRYRVCRSSNCPDDGFESEQITCYKPNCPLCVLDFEVVQNHVVLDQSGYRNYAYLDAHVEIREHSQICGHYADFTNQGEILFSAPNFIGKPRTGITIAAWVNIQDTVAGKHSIFSTVRKIGTSFIGGYHFEIDDGRVRWFHRDDEGVTIFNMITEVVISPGVWMHVAGTYDAYKRLCNVYVDGKARGSKEGSGLLSGDWGYKASIGYYDFDDRKLAGWLDEFLIYDFAMTEEEVFKLLGKMRCPISNITSVEIDAFQFENIDMRKRAVLEDPNYEEGVLVRIRHKPKLIVNKNNKYNKRSNIKRSMDTLNKNRSKLPVVKTMKENIKGYFNSTIPSSQHFSYLRKKHDSHLVTKNKIKESPHR